MKKNKFEDFIKTNSKEIYQEDSVILTDDNKNFEELLNQELPTQGRPKRRIIHLKYWLTAAAVLTAGLILSFHIYTDKNTYGNADNVENYLFSVNSKIDSLVKKVEAIDQVEHAVLISDLKQLKIDNQAFIESAKTNKPETIIIDIKAINDQQMIMLSNLEQNLEGIFTTDK